MSKIAKQKALEEYPKDYAYAKCDEDETNYSEIDSDGIKWLKVDINKTNRDCYIKGYDQAMQDLLKDANQYMYLSDEIGYAYACGCRKTMQDFLDKAEEFLYLQLNNGSIECGNIERLIEDFKNYMQDESEN